MKTIENTVKYSNTGGQWDAEAEIYHYRARAYDPETGRFLQQDPVFSVNPYPYVSNNPVNYTDPFGLYFLSDQKIPDYCKGADCHFTRTYSNNNYCEYTGCGICGTECQDCIVGKDVEYWSKEEPGYSEGCRRYNMPHYIGDASCHRCWWGPRIADCANKCQHSTDRDCIPKCLRSQTPGSEGGDCDGGKGGKRHKPKPFVYASVGCTLVSIVVPRNN